MSLLKQKIIEKIKSEGPINFEKFMEMCLYYPQLGYYTKDSTKIGKSGDFYTSPHLHPIFGAMIGRQMKEMWEIMDFPQDFHIVEIGAGMGYLSKDMLEYIRKSEKSFFHSLSYTIIELNNSLKSEQQSQLLDFNDKVNWISSIDKLETITGCFISNELLDAFPVRLVEIDDEIKEIYISIDGDELIEVKMPCSDEIKDYFREFDVKLPNNYRTEVNLRIKDWLREVNDKLKEGFILTIDYGYSSGDYYNEERNRGTILCYHRHIINEDFFNNIGEQDITAHVNFSSLKRWGEDMGVKTIGFCPQGIYLISLGIDEVIKDLLGETPDFFDIARIKGLILPQGMGESHKIMIQYKGNREIKMKGFQFKNRVNTL